jgi:hypothetical protein
MTCPDPECHRNVEKIENSVKKISDCSGNKVKRWELWTVVFCVLSIVIPVLSIWGGSVAKTNKERDKKITSIEKRFEVAESKYQKDINSINEKISEIKKQQEQIGSVVYRAVKAAVKDANK